MDSESKPIRTKDDFLVFGKPDIREAEIEEIIQTMKSGWLGTGPRVAQFEREFEQYKHSGHAVAVNSCTAALHLSLLAADLGNDAEVITTPLTFCATVNAIIHAGATPVLADVDRQTMNLDPARVRDAITDKTKALLPVHFAGRPCEMEALQEIAQEHNLHIIEDCAHALEATYKGIPTGSFGLFGCFSFYATKNLTTGEGGMVLARSEEHAARIKTLSLHGLSKDAWKRYSDDGYKHYYVGEVGFKYNMMDLQAAIGLHQLARIEAGLERREQIWKHYDNAFQNAPVETPLAIDHDPDSRHALHLYTILIDSDQAGIKRDQFIDRMTAENIGVGVQYLSLPEHPYYRETFNWKPEDYPNATAIGRQTVSLPLGANLTDDDIADVVQAAKRALS